MHSERTVLYQSLSFIDEMITWKFCLFPGVHIVMLNILVGKPMIEMQTQVGLKLFSNTSKHKDRLSSAAYAHGVLH